MPDRSTRKSRLCAAFAAAIALGLALPAWPAALDAELYLFDSAGSDDQLRRVNQTNGSSVAVGSYFPADIGGLTSRPNDPVVYAVGHANLSGDHWLRTLDPSTGGGSILTVIDPAWLGFQQGPAWQMDALAISPSEPDVAVVAGWNSALQFRIARIDLNTLQPIGGPITTGHNWGALTFTPDGKKLLGSTGFYDTDHPADSKLYEIDPLTGAATLIGDTGSSDLTGLAFHPGTHELFAIDAYQTDAIVVLDPQTGAQTRVVGPTGRHGPSDLAFLPAAVPEPGSAALIGLASITLLRRRRRG